MLSLAGELEPLFGHSKQQGAVVFGPRLFGKLDTFAGVFSVFSRRAHGSHLHNQAQGRVGDSIPKPSLCVKRVVVRRNMSFFKRGHCEIQRGQWGLNGASTDLREAAHGDLVGYMLNEMDAVARGE
jgi:hypothetical protein